MQCNVLSAVAVVNWFLISLYLLFGINAGIRSGRWWAVAVQSQLEGELESDTLYNFLMLTSIFYSVIQGLFGGWHGPIQSLDRCWQHAHLIVLLLFGRNKVGSKFVNTYMYITTCIFHIVGDQKRSTQATTETHWVANNMVILLVNLAVKLCVGKAG